MSAAEPLRWWQRGVIYQIYPRSFADSTGDGVGDLQGVLTHLGYLASLGVEAIWLSPFYPSPMADFGYDVADYTGVDPLFGTLADFDALVDAAHRRGIKVVVDYVPNHTSDQHPWFTESRSGRHSPKRDWYVWRDPAPGGGPPNNWRSSFRAVGGAWRFDGDSGQYYLHSYLPQQPDLNWENPEVEAAMHDVLRFWLRRGADGFRLDAISRIAKDPQLRDNEPGLRHDQDWPSIHDRLRRIRNVVAEFDDAMIVGEVYLLDPKRVVAYINSGDQLHLAHNFVFVNVKWDAAAVRESVEEFVDLAAPGAWPTWLLENHDHSRVATRYAAGPGTGERRARLAAMLVCTLRGTPFLYQGQELGLPDAVIPTERRVDVDGRDPERAPMPWLPPSRYGPGAGFTMGQPWLPVVTDADSLCVASQEGDPDSTLHFVRRLMGVRARLATLQHGWQRTVQAGAEVFCFAREAEDRLLAALNFGSRQVPLRLGEHMGERAVVELSTDPRRSPGPVSLADFVLGPDEGVLLRVLP
ncbi:MAG TPA: alpha-amylase family glycosyl hydrolase [Streptosporangiaceae bacterium]|nr:alpha-amylase family glycosyl hydrolase [Streptosporangiaceae bacterium]